MSHNCKSILIHCIDFRLIEKTREWMKENKYLGDCDVVSLAGASKSIIDGDGKDIILKQIGVCSKLHCGSNVILLHHSDCGAYKNSYDFKSKEEEKGKQMEDMENAAKIIKEAYPDMEVIKFWAEMKDGEGKEVEFIRI